MEENPKTRYFDVRGNRCGLYNELNKALSELPDDEILIIPAYLKSKADLVNRRYGKKIEYQTPVSTWNVRDLSLTPDDSVVRLADNTFEPVSGAYELLAVSSSQITGIIAYIKLLTDGTKWFSTSELLKLAGFENVTTTGAAMLKPEAGAYRITIHKDDNGYYSVLLIKDTEGD